MSALGAMPPLNDYSLCRQTVTVYHHGPDGITRTVHDRAYMERTKTEEVTRTGSSEKNGFLLVIPGDAQACRIGDKVLEGDGPEVPTSDADAWWRSFIPAKVDGLVVVRHVSVGRWDGRIVHTEAGA